MSEQQTNTLKPKIVYFSFIIGLFFWPATILAISLAHFYKVRDENPEWLESHYTFQQFTFYYALIYVVIGILLAAYYVGLVILLWAIIWIIIRVAKGLKAVYEEQPIPNPKQFLGFGFKPKEEETQTS